MKNCTIITLIFFLTFGCTNNTRNIDYWPNGKKKTEIIVEKGTAEKPQEYILISYYNNGEIFKTGKVVNGKEQGNWLYYFADGNLKSENEYSNGSLNGQFKTYYRNGIIKQEGSYVSGQLADARHFDKVGKERKNTSNQIQPSLEIEPWTLNQVDLMITECIATQEVNYSNPANFCDCMIKSIAVQYSLEKYSNLSQAETNLAYENMIRDEYCTVLRKEKNAR